MKQRTSGYAIEEPKAVYVLGSDAGYYKIGVSTDPRQRMRDLQGGMPFELKLLGYKFLAQSQHAFAIEDALQTFCRPQRVRGEWFKDIDVPAVLKRMESEARYYNGN